MMKRSSTCRSCSWPRCLSPALLPAAALAQRGLFNAPRDFVAGAIPSPSRRATSTATASADLAVANYGSTRLRAAGQRRRDLPARRWTFAAGANPHAWPSADLNGDGKLDVATANFGSNNVSVLLGNGDGTLQAPTTFAVAAGPRRRRVATSTATSGWTWPWPTRPQHRLGAAGQRRRDLPARADLRRGQRPVRGAPGPQRRRPADLAVANFGSNESRCCWATATGPSRRR